MKAKFLNQYNLGFKLAKHFIYFLCSQAINTLIKIYLDCCSCKQLGNWYQNPHNRHTHILDYEIYSRLRLIMICK